MTSADIQSILAGRRLLDQPAEIDLKETHISWVLLTQKFAYKIKKPVRYSFLDFSTPEKRGHYCRRELELNRRLAPQMYLDVLPVRQDKIGWSVGGDQGEIRDHALRMRRMDDHRQLDVLLLKGQVGALEMEALAGVLAAFHLTANRIEDAEDWGELYAEFEDVQQVAGILGSHIGGDAPLKLALICEKAQAFLQANRARIEARKAAGFVIDGHGDLHCRNIFMEDPPVIFDCIEFNDEFRILDLLSEVGFLCMDLERFGRADLAEAFCKAYFKRVPCMEEETDRRLFRFYKLYRANVRLKVEALSLSGTDTDTAIAARMASYYRLFLDYAKAFI